jgi:hypothetical protein
VIRSLFQILLELSNKKLAAGGKITFNASVELRLGDQLS